MPIIGMAGGLCALTLAACAKDKAPTPEEIIASRPELSYFRVVNVSDSTVDYSYGQLNGNELEPGTATAYILLPQEPTDLEVISSSATLNHSFEPEEGTNYTLVISGAGEGLGLELISTMARELTPGESGVYLINGLGQSATLTIRDESVDASASGASDLLAIGPGRTKFDVNASGQSTEGELEVADGRAYTILLYQDDAGLHTATLDNNAPMEFSAGAAAASP